MGMTTPILPRGKSGQKITLLSVGPEAALVIQIGHVMYELKAQDMPMWQQLLLPSKSQSSRRYGSTNMGISAKFVLQALF